MLIDFNIHGVSAFGAPLPFDSQLEKSFSNWLPEKMKNVAQIRQQEFIAGRYCAFQAAKMVGFDLVTLPSAETREPLWPEGVFGSITHSKKMAISCVSVSDALSSVGVDAEELIKPSLSAEVEKVIATDEELALLGKIEYQKGITILFSAKEALYKALFPLVRTFIDFKEVKLTQLNSDEGSFELELLSTNVKLSNYLGRYKGSFKQLGETIVTVVSVPKSTTRGNYVHS
jgi:4'-phosphopantetheinyl transferase EntD